MPKIWNQKKAWPNNILLSGRDYHICTADGKYIETQTVLLFSASNGALWILKIYKFPFPSLTLSITVSLQFSVLSIMFNFHYLLLYQYNFPDFYVFIRAPSLFIIAACGYCPFISYINFLFRVPEEEFLKAFKNYPRLKTKVNNFHSQKAQVRQLDEDFVAIRPEWTVVDRILACRLSF